MWFSKKHHNCDQVLQQFTFLFQKVSQIMASIQDIKDKLVALQASVANETTVDQSIITLVQGLSSSIGDLKKQLADALASNDPTALQAVVDGLGAVPQTVDANAASIAAAVTTNTPSA
jgi:hypothetical protein